MVGRTRRELIVAAVGWEWRGKKMTQHHSRVQSKQGLLTRMWSLDFILSTLGNH